MKWISVKDEIPPLEGNFYFMNENGLEGNAYWHNGTQKFCIEIGEQGLIYTGRITHWMPLPKPPKV